MVSSPASTGRRRHSFSLGVPPLPSRDSAAQPTKVPGSEAAPKMPASTGDALPVSLRTRSLSNASLPLDCTDANKNRMGDSKPPLKPAPSSVQNRSMERQNSLPSFASTILEPRDTPKEEESNGNFLNERELHDKHFLHGIQLDRVNVFSIPDPPSPVDHGMNRRRQSSALIRPLRDVGNDSENGSSPSREPIAATKTTKRSRNSLCHVPSPALPPSPPEVAPGTGDTPSPTSDPTDETVSKNDVSLDTSVSVVKRRKKRYSMVLPSDAAAQEDTTSAYFQTFLPAPEPTDTPAFKKLVVDSTYSSSNFTPSNKPVKDELAILRNYVRSYTNLPQEDREQSVEARRIEELFGYILSPPLPDSIDPASIPTNTQGSKMEVLMQLGPELKRIDEVKLNEIQTVQNITECSVEKAHGKYRYIHDPTSRRVSAQEYEQRYMLMLTEINRIRSQDWKEYFDQIESSSFGTLIRSPMTGDRSHELTAMKNLASVMDSAIKANENAEENGCDDLDENEGMDLEETSEELLTKMDQAVSMENERFGTAPVEKEIEIQQTHTSPNNDCETSFQALTPVVQNGQVLLPLPSRDDVSSDPEEAAAEERLWLAFDAALEKYSAEILAIRARHEKLS